MDGWIGWMDGVAQRARERESEGQFGCCIPL